MLTIRNQNLEKEMVSKDLLNAKIRESINREYTLSFSIMHDYEKTQYIKPFNIAEIEDDYFDIAYFKENHNENGSKTIEVECEHVSYRLNDEQYDLEYFASYGTAQQILSQILANTPFTVGTVDVTGSYHFSIQEEMSRRGILVLFAEEIGAELKFNKFTISLLQKRGKDEGQQFRIGKNVRGVTREIDTREMVDGQPKTAYEINLVELSFAQGYANLENIELGDTWKVIDEEINLVTTQRVVSYEYDPINKINSRAEIANFIDDLSDELYKIQRTTLVKERLYNGIRIGPEHGFEAIRSDNRARTVMNATEGIKIQKGDGSGNSWVDVIFLDTEGNARFTGRIDASEFIGGLINIGNGNFTVDSDGNVNIKRGSINIANKFIVDSNGKMEAIDGKFKGTIEGSEIIGGEIRGAHITADATIDVGTNASIGQMLILNPIDFNNGIRWGKELGNPEIFIDPVTKALFLSTPSGNVYVNSEKIATQQWVLQQIQQALNN